MSTKISMLLREGSRRACADARAKLNDAARLLREQEVLCDRMRADRQADDDDRATATEVIAKLEIAITAINILVGRI